MAAEVKNYMKEMWDMFCNWKTVMLIWGLVLVFGLRYISLYHIDYSIMEGKPWYYIQFKDIPEWLTISLEYVRNVYMEAARYVKGAVLTAWEFVKTLVLWLTYTVNNMLKW